MTILIHKKNSTHDPANFCPITLQSILLKVLKSVVRNKLFIYLTRNNYIETNFQKGFTPGMTGTYEHTAWLAHIILQAKKKQQLLEVTLLDLQKKYTTI